MEPYIESFPSFVVYVNIIVVEIVMKHNKQLEHSDNPGGRYSLPFYLFLASVVASVLISNFGILKFFKNGPGHFLPDTGFLNGFGSPKTVMTFFSIFSCNMTRIMILVGLLESRTAERILYSLNISGPLQHQQITLLPSVYNFGEYIYNENITTASNVGFISEHLVRGSHFGEIGD